MLRSAARCLGPVIARGPSQRVQRDALRQQKTITHAEPRNRRCADQARGEVATGLRAIAAETDRLMAHSSDDVSGVAQCLRKNKARATSASQESQIYQDVQTGRRQCRQDDHGLCDRFEGRLRRCFATLTPPNWAL